MVRVECPHCGFARELGKEKLPRGPARVTCPKCRRLFPLAENVIPVIAAEPPEAPQPQPSRPAPDSSPTAPAVLVGDSSAAADSGENAEPASEEVTVTCPHCNYQRRVQRAILPERPSRVSCHGCRQLFIISRDLAGSPMIPPAPAIPPPAPRTGEARPVAGPEEAQAAVQEDGGDELSLPSSNTPGRLPGVKDLVLRSWQIFRRRIWTCLGIFLLGGMLSLVPAFLLSAVQVFLASGIEGNPIAAMLSGAVALIFTSLVVTWITAALLHAVADEEAGVRVSLGLGLQRIWAFAWLFGLLGFIIGGGGLLLLVPGILFSVWFFFAQFILAAEDMRGMDALLKSRAYVRGYGWPVFVRLLTLALATSVISFALFFVPLLGQLVSLFLVPFALIYYFLIYQDLRQLKGDIAFDCSRRTKLKWIGAAACGYVVLPALALSLLLPMLGVAPGQLLGGDALFEWLAPP